MSLVTGEWKWTPLGLLTSTDFIQTEAGQSTFEKVKQCFTTAPTLCHTDPDNPLILEVP